MRRKWRRTAGLAAVLSAALILAFAIGCDREEYDPEAFAPEQQAGGGGSHHYSLQVEGTELEADSEDVVSVQVFPSSDLRINLDFPWSFEVQDAGGLEIDEVELSSDDMELTEQRAAIPLKVAGAQQGEYRVEATGNFSVCNDEICHTLRGEDVEFVVDAR